MQFTDFNRLDLNRLPSPCFVVDEAAVERNLAILQTVSRQAGVKVLQALKAFSMYSLAPLCMRYLDGTCCSGLLEAKLAHEFYPGEIHVFAAGYSEDDLRQLLEFADHIVFNTVGQLVRYEDLCRTALQRRPGLRFGIRINPEHSEGEVAIYDPCAPGSRLGTTCGQLRQSLKDPQVSGAFEIISGLHFHTLCEHLFEPLERTIKVVVDRFGDLLHGMEWLNLGGGHHISHPGYDVPALIGLLGQLKEDYSVDLYLEPGEAIAIGTGVLVGEVLDLGYNELPQAILNVSATCHMPDTLEMPYRAEITGAEQPGIKAYTYRLGGLSCLAGDIIGDYSFDKPLQIGQRIVFENMSHYTMVKTTTFNGTRLPAIAIWNSQTDELRIIKEFGYAEFKSRI